MEDLSTATLEEIFEVINKLDEAGKRCILRLGRDILFIDEVRNETAKTGRNNESAC